MQTQRKGTDRRPEQAATAGLEFAGLDKLLGYDLRRAQGAVHRAYLVALGELKLTQKHTAVLWLVEANPGVSQGSIGSALEMDRATMMVLVDRLESRELLRRVRSKEDGRRRELHLTNAGQRMLRGVRERVTRHERQIKGLYSSIELQQLQHLLQRLQNMDGG